MIVMPTTLSQACLIELERREDERGFLARSWCAKEFEAHGMAARFVQCNVSYSKKKGTLRGMHYQAPPYAEAKLVRCTMGSIYDVIIDLRPDSATFSQHFTVTLSAQNRLMLYIPEGMAHGFQTLDDHTEVFYQMSQYYAPEYARGVRWNDPAFAIEWPVGERIISERDQTFADFTPEQLS